MNITNNKTLNNNLKSFLNNIKSKFTFLKNKLRSLYPLKGIIQFSVKAFASAKNFGSKIENLNLPMFWKISGTICILIILFNKHVLFYLYITYFIIMFSVFHLLVVLVMSLVKLITGITKLFSMNGLVLTINNILKIVGIIILLNKIYVKNSEIFYDICCFYHNYLVFSLLLVFTLFFFSKIQLFVKNYKFIKYLKQTTYVVCTFVLFVFITLSNTVILCDKTDDDNNTNNNNNNSNKNNHDSNNTNIETKDNKFEYHAHLHAEQIVKTTLDTVGKAIDSGLTQAASQIGVAGSITGGMAAGATIRAGQPPITRLGTTVVCGAVGGALHVTATAANRALNQPRPTLSNNTVNKPTDIDRTPSPGNGFIESPNEEISINNLITDNPIELWLGSLLVLNIASLILLFFLLLAVISKIILSLNYKLNWIDYVLPSSLSPKVKSVLLVSIKFLAKVREYNIIMIILFLIFISIFIIYYFSLFIINLEELCKLYLELKK